MGSWPVNSVGAEPVPSQLIYFVVGVGFVVLYFFLFVCFTVAPLFSSILLWNYLVNIVPGQHSNKRVVWKYLYMQFLTKLFSGFDGKSWLCVWHKEVSFAAEGRCIDATKYGCLKSSSSRKALTSVTVSIRVSVDLLGGGTAKAVRRGFFFFVGVFLEWFFWFSSHKHNS